MLNAALFKHTIKYQNFLLIDYVQQLKGYCHNYIWLAFSTDHLLQNNYCGKSDKANHSCDNNFLTVYIIKLEVLIVP